MIIVLIILLSSLSAQTFEIKEGQINYYGTHFLHDWVGVSNDLNGKVFIANDQSDHFVELNVHLRSFNNSYSRFRSL